MHDSNEGIRKTDFSEFLGLLTTLWLQTKKTKGVGTKNVRGISLFQSKEGGIGCLEPCPGPNLALFETPLLDV